MERNYHQAGTFLDRINRQHPLHGRVSKATLIEWMAHYDDRVWPNKQTAKEKTEILAGGEFLRKYSQIKEYVLILSSWQLNLLVDLFHIEPASTEHGDLADAVVDYAHTLDDPSDSEDETAPPPRPRDPKKLISPADRLSLAGARSPSGSSSNASDDSQADEPAAPHHELFETATSSAKKTKKPHAHDEESVIDTGTAHQPKAKKGKPASGPVPDGNDSDS
jgi:hypothetical protein